MATSVQARGPAPSLRRRVSGLLNRHPRVKLLLTLGPPLGWMGVVYLGALSLLLVSAFWRIDPLTSGLVKQFGLSNVRTLIHDPVYRTIALRTIGIAAAVTITDIVLALPVAYFVARLASPKVRSAILVMVVLPLWSSYLVRVYAWRVILDKGGLMNWTLGKLHLGGLNISFTNWAVWITFSYIWLPFVILPIYASLERVPNSYLEASSDMGATWWTTFRRLILPLALPGIVAGSIFSFSLTLGDYIAPSLVGNTQFIGNVVYGSVGVSNNVPFGAAFAMVPVLVMAVYLVVARRLHAFEAL